MSAIDPIDGALLALVADDRVASKGNGDMQYFAAVFRGQSPSDACATGR